MDSTQSAALPLNMDPSTSEAEENPGLTSLHIQRAGTGDIESLGWLVSRFAPFLEAQAEYRLRGPLRRLCEPADLVDEVWAVTLPRLADLRDRDNHLTPVLLRFLGTTLLHKVNHLLTQHLRAGRGERPVPASSISVRDTIDHLPAEVTSVLSFAVRDENCRMLREAIERLEPQEREVLVLRGIEQLPYAEISAHLGEALGAVTMRYHRTLEKLRASLARVILDELPAE